ncbi:DUF1501 domain-containing protein [Aquimarina muelleri]|uniref:DUF1501 domain-containing protein n=1 Tax=Aquimarina muelleri TaxID=279356 RepID=A0A918JTN8_9FLAO|nr:DUF1501 domain-containing protein [Aquimarina muelleri]MCX2761295.1 DUF1501 domain-containing protein [Aquimarina muelleri]GGX12344.1 hypothetical protein GCM10007384_12660 [Aquimarina muelleri]
MSDTNKPYTIQSNKKGSCNTEDHVKWNRRSFLQALGLVGGGTMMLANTPLSVSRPSPLSIALSQAENDNILILCRLSGGNDGFNTIIPVYDYDIYANARPLIKIPPSEFISLSDEYAMPKPMNKLESVWGDGQMKIVHGVGYEDSSLSHFKGSDIYANTNLVEEDRTGFMGRYFQDIYPDYVFNPPASPPSIQIGSIGNLIFKGPENDFSFAVSDPKRLLQIAQNGTSYNTEGLGECTYNDKVRHLREVTNTTFTYADVISAAYDKSGPTDFAGYLDDSLGRQLSIISRLIKGGLGTKVYLVTLGGFDTHNNQTQRHQELLNSFSEAISTFYKDLTAAGWDDKVLTMTMSEFGRRFKENGSLGTDHGTAAPTMFFGTALNGNGFVGEHPDLSNLTRGGNVFNTTDFRQVYATVMKEWLCVDETTVGKVLLGGSYESLDLGFNCSGTNPNIPTDGDGITHIVTYSDNQTYINIATPETTHMDIALYNVIGQKVATLRNEVVMEGELIIDVKQSANTRLSTGPYIYRIETNKGNYSRSILIS